MTEPDKKFTLADLMKAKELMEARPTPRRKAAFYVFKPMYSVKGGWVVHIREGKSPRSPIIDIIPCATREQAWQTYRRIKAGGY